MNGKGDNTASRTDWKKWFSEDNPLPDRQIKLWPRDKEGNLIEENVNGFETKRSS